MVTFRGHASIDGRQRNGGLPQAYQLWMGMCLLQIRRVDKTAHLEIGRRCFISLATAPQGCREQRQPVDLGYSPYLMLWNIPFWMVLCRYLMCSVLCLEVVVALPPTPVSGCLAAVISTLRLF
jgi:hypothetical protein